MLHKTRFRLLVLIIGLFFVSCRQQLAVSDDQEQTNPVMLVSFDGFRYDYLTKTDTPNFDQLISNGVKSESLIPVFPTKTFPNHYAIVTGLYPENNGIISNNMLDPETGKRYSIRNRDAVEDPMWYQGEPIWNTVEKQGKKAGIMFWVGSEAPVQNMRPTYWNRYDGSIPDSARVDSVVQWLSGNETEKVDFASLYFSFTDSQGHRVGPESPQINGAIQRADDTMGYLVEELEAAQLFERTNIIIVSDHGMAQVSRDRVVVLDDIVDIEHLEIIDLGQLGMLNVDDPHLENVYNSLEANQNHYRVYKTKDIPERFHLKEHPRVTDLLLIPDIGYTITTSEFLDRNPNYPSGGAHGYDNHEKEMHSFFIAHGPDFEKNKTVDSFEVVHIYELMCEILGLDPAENDGNLQEIENLLIK
ncbi:alkaline phosphatase family protein [Rhodohalobacter sulfatireducens]|uniref:Ectonucleotide pyrophosphatase/phosphodiesterase n=1 Tax=Rhodohalobacter sulfatireducens TaxID=2911366 RepID=A0ABS9KCC4_9BACT|nr:ectonucleotide pyrophosphatase/phosphodiesterase [Rhodohalobacter sulfatireducens]MCG2588504.1 ectonucleotide pyrophosphatase/phosphodiesterase [Rhodohalobacter sulfatireducens]